MKFKVHPLKRSMWLVGKPLANLTKEREIEEERDREDSNH